MIDNLSDFKGIAKTKKTWYKKLTVSEYKE